MPSLYTMYYSIYALRYPHVILHEMFFFLNTEEHMTYGWVLCGKYHSPYQKFEAIITIIS